MPRLETLLLRVSALGFSNFRALVVRSNGQPISYDDYLHYGSNLPLGEWRRLNKYLDEYCVLSGPAGCNVYSKINEKQSNEELYLLYHHFAGDGDLTTLGDPRCLFCARLTDNCRCDKTVHRETITTNYGSSCATLSAVTVLQNYLHPDLRAHLVNHDFLPSDRYWNGALTIVLVMMVLLFLFALYFSLK